MSTYKIVDADKLDADLTSVADTIRERSCFSGALGFPDGFKAGVDNVRSVGYDEGYSIGYHEGDQNGYSEGYDDGYEEGAKNSFTPPTSDVLDPDEVYRTTRPSDWLPLPTPNDNEMYFLGHLIPNADNKFHIWMEFSGACTIEFGNYVNGVFTAKETTTPTSGQPFSHSLNYSDYGDETLDGYRQYIVRIYAGGRVGKLSGYAYAFYQDVAPILVEFVCGKALDWFTCSDGSAEERRNRTFAHTRYIRFVGNGTFGNGTTMFCGCKKLIALCHDRTDVSAEYCNYMFTGCRSLLAVPSHIFSQRSAYCSATFWASSALPKLPKINVSLDTGYFFCYMAEGLEEFDGTYIDTSKVSDMYLMFSGCASLTKVKALNISALTNTGGLFGGCYCLNSVTFAGTSTPGGYTIDLSNASLGRTALVETLNSLPEAMSPATINIANNPGASELTDAYLSAVADPKNWTITR